MNYWRLLSLVAIIKNCVASGYFEIQILSMTNIRGEVSDGSCCSARAHDNRTCQGECDTYFRVCLKQYESQVALAGPCTFGNLTTPLMGGNSFRYALNVSTSSLKLPFHFSWTRSYTIIVTGWDRDWNQAQDKLIERSAHSGIILPGRSWHTLTHNGPTASMVYRIRVMCDQHYYNDTCSKFCRPHNDRLGHYTCNANGDKVCMGGWLGTDCDIAICKTGCHAIHGSCERPGECRCSFGWQGPLCDQCIPYPECQHGSCNNSPWTCNCHLNWGGILCNKDLNTCRHKPCKNHGLCMNTSPDNYTCACSVGFSGRNCEIVDDPCSSYPCQNGGLCRNTVGGYTCNCRPGWSGDTCNIDINECESYPCLNSGTCVDQQNGYECLCPQGWQGPHCQQLLSITYINECESYPCLNSGTCVDQQNGYECLCPQGWQGPHCQLDADECEGRPCVNAHTCKDLVGDYHCECQPGWTGKNCDFNMDDCQSQCKNGGQCVDLIADYYCICLPGYEGKDCQTVVHECESNPCANGATCIDQVPGYVCHCAEGYSGFDCQIDIDPCSPNPCMHEGTCYITDEDYFCYCPEAYHGKNCEHPKTMLINSVDSCTISIPTNDTVGGVQIISSGICGKHGLCISKPGGGFECSCSSGYTGTYCHTNIDDCSSSPCQNSGTCVDLVRAYQCICSEGWEGALCNINKNECNPNPCRNRGACVDLVAGYVCQCVDGWKGKTCTLRDSQCDMFTCANGGRCVDLRDTFACKCPSGWEGNTCHIPTARGCDSNPCVNNGTCVNSGDSFTCICKEGFEGATCQSNVNDCNPFPCYNGGNCIDGINRFMCECTTGFSGPDCRVNINECLSSPCTYGSTCIDGIGEFRCVCPPGRSGDRCEKVAGRPPAAHSCEFHRRTYHDNTTWEHDCNVCRCDDGKITCIELWCGPSNCFQRPNSTLLGTVCGDHEICVVQNDVTCFTPPCLPVGQCRPKVMAQSSVAASEHTPCLHRGQQLPSNCARVTLVFDKAKTPIGVSVEGICSDIQSLAAAQAQVNTTTIYISCRSPRGLGDAIQIIMFQAHEPFSSHDPYVPLRTAVDRVADVISRKQTSSLALSAVIEVKVETSIIDDRLAQDPQYLLPLVCSLIALLGAVALGLVIMWHCRRQHDINRWRKATDLIDEKTNNENIENFQNLRRYRNPLYERDKVNANSNLRSMELHDVDKYQDIEPDLNDRSPTRLLRHEDIANDWAENMRCKTKIKDINIELNKSRYRPYRKDFHQIMSEIELDENEVIV